MAGIPPFGDISLKIMKPLNIANNHTNNINQHSFKSSQALMNKHKPLPAISNIPGLNPDSETIAAAEKKVFRTFKIHEADSSYVKLAKQGGRKNLLEYEEFKKDSIVFTVKDINKENKIGNQAEEEEPQDENSNDLNGNSSNVKNKNVSSSGSKPCKIITEIKKQVTMTRQSAALSQRNGNGKERPELLPVDNIEILKHLSAPKRLIFPKIKKQPRLASRLLRIGSH